MDVTLLYFDGCPNWQIARDRLAELADEYDLDVEPRKVETPEEAEATGFTGSPTILIGGLDPFATGNEPPGLACRVYQTPDGLQGSPTVDQLREVLG